jgi:alkanesulfonate monooxygenase SsuD/methylene tetrahydromethanopterin reductase-like flavin-dependent oxidoreductase (luciferase family)
MEWWLNFSMVDIDRLIPLACAAESLGFAGVSMGDHLVFPRELSSAYPYSADGRVKWRPQDPWPDPWVSIAAMTTATTRLRFTTGVFILPLRHPVELAKSLGTAARLSGERVIAGFGAGWMREEFDLVGEAFERRGARMDEMIEVLRKLWTGEMIEHHGEFYDLPGVQMSPPPCCGRRCRWAAAGAARCEGWIGVHSSFEVTEPLVGRVREMREKAGGGPFTLMLNAFRTTPEDRARFADLGFDAVVLPALGLAPGRTLDEQLDGLARAAADLGLERARAS